MDPHFGLPVQFPSAFAAVNTPIPLDQRTHEGRYIWEPRIHPLAQTGAIVNSQLDPLHSSYCLSPYVDQFYTLHASPTASVRGLSPADARGLPVSSDYIQQMAALGQRSLLGDIHGQLPSTSVANTELPFYMDGSRVTSPRSGLRYGRKRALSSSPYSDCFDINSMIRFSPNSLMSFMNGSRSSSASGSYGHLSAGTISPALGIPPSTIPPQLQQLHHLMRQGSMTSPLILSSPSGVQQPLLTSHIYPPFNTANLDSVEMNGGREMASNIVSSTVDTEETKYRVKREKATSSIDPLADDDKDGSNEMKDEPGDFIETNCHWTDCHKEYPTQDDLVKHINSDHIHGNKKSFVCRWQDCSRDEKPFKAQYMLVVHMRRHTGEKPHRCTFEGCTKAYSRLENLKTHLRSHTGEKPYMCEFPGCSKAFSNASDRAKHQNRTHSNEKPYVCKAPGCTKRYTDPSSLRKHVKTVHGAEFYANKKHKGWEGSGDHKDDRNPDLGSNQGSPNSDDGTCGIKSVSVSSPSTKSEDQGSPQNVSSPGEETQSGEGPPLSSLDAPISDNSVSTTSGPSEVMEADNSWDLVDSGPIDLEEAIPSVATVGYMVSSSRSQGEKQGGSGGSIRNRIKSKLQATFKAPRSWLPNILPSRGEGLNRHAETSTNSSKQRLGVSGTATATTTTTTSGSSRKPLLKLSFRSNRNDPSKQQTSPNNKNIRRDSNTSSTVSSFYSSMGSDFSQSTHSTQSIQPQNSGGPSVRSRRDSQTSHTHRDISSPCDPISLGSSRKSSDSMSSLPPGVSAHLQRLHSRALASQHLAATSNLVVQRQGSALSSADLSYRPRSSVYSSQSNRNSESCRIDSPSTVRLNSVVSRPISTSCSPTCENARNNADCNMPAPPLSRQEAYPVALPAHPNENVVLDACEENKPIEELNDLVLPDEMVCYLSQVQNTNQNIPPRSAATSPTMNQPASRVVQNEQYNCYQNSDKYTAGNSVPLQRSPYSNPVPGPSNQMFICSGYPQNQMQQQNFSGNNYNQNLIYAQQQNNRCCRFNNSGSSNITPNCNHPQTPSHRPISNMEQQYASQNSGINWNQNMCVQSEDHHRHNDNSNFTYNYYHLSHNNSRPMSGGLNPATGQRGAHPQPNMCNHMVSSPHTGHMYRPPTQNFFTHPQMFNPCHNPVQESQPMCGVNQHSMIHNVGVNQNVIQHQSPYPTQQFPNQNYNTNSGNLCTHQSQSVQDCKVQANYNENTNVHYLNNSNVQCVPKLQEQPPNSCAMSPKVNALHESMQNCMLTPKMATHGPGSVQSCSMSMSPKTPAQECNMSLTSPKTPMMTETVSHPPHTQTCNMTQDTAQQQQHFLQHQHQHQNPHPHSHHNHVNCCRNCSAKTEIQCKNVSQSSFSNMPPEAYQRTLEYVQQCQQMIMNRSMHNLGPTRPDINEMLPVEVPATACTKLSQGCNTVTSSTDKLDKIATEGINDITYPITSVTPSQIAVSETLMPTSGAIVAEAVVPPPNYPDSKSNSEPSLLVTSNMVINDMNSTLNSLMQETRYLRMLQ